MITWLRRVFWTGLLAGGGFAAWSWYRRDTASTPADAPEWPPIPTDETPPASDETPPASAEGADASADADPDASTDGTTEGDGRWVPPIDGACPDGYPIKANDNSGIFHVPGGRFYERTAPERCYATAEHALEDGYRQAKA